VMKRSRLYPRPAVASGAVSAVGQAGGVLLTETIRAAGLDVGLSTGLTRWWRPGAVHDPAKVLLDLAVALALGGDCLADVAMLRAEAGGVRVGGLGSDGVADDHGPGLRHPGCPRRDRHRAGFGAGEVAAPLVIDLDATLVTAHSTGGGPDVQARVRVSPVVCVRRLRPGGYWGDGRGAASARQRRFRATRGRTCSVDAP